MEIHCVIIYQYSVTVNDSVKPVSNGEDCTHLKLVPDSLLNEAVSSKGERNTTPQHKKLSSYRPLGRDFTPLRTMVHQQKGMCSSSHSKIKEIWRLSLFDLWFCIFCIITTYCWFFISFISNWLHECSDQYFPYFQRWLNARLFLKDMFKLQSFQSFRSH